MESNLLCDDLFFRKIATYGKTRNMNFVSLLRHYMDDDFRNTYLNDDMTEYEKMDMVAWYLSSFFEYDADCYSWVPYLLLGRGDCLASRTTVMWMCRYFGIKACACNNLNYHGETLVQADGKLYILSLNLRKTEYYILIPLSIMTHMRNCRHIRIYNYVCAIRRR